MVENKDFKKDPTLPFGRTREKIKDLVAGHEEEYLSISSLATQIGISKQTIGIHLRKLSDEGYPLPLTRAEYLREQKARKQTAKQAEEEARNRLESEIKRLRKEERLGNTAIANSFEEHLPVSFVEHILREAEQKDSSYRLRNKKRSKEELEAEDSKVLELYQKGLTYGEISKETGIKESMISSSVRRLVNKNKLIRRS